MASNYMVKVYADLIRKGKKTIEEVPDPLQAAVREILEIARMELRAYEKPSAPSFIHSDGKGGSSYGSCLRDPDRQGQEDHDQVPSLIRKQVEEILADLEVTV